MNTYGFDMHTTTTFPARIARSVGAAIEQAGRTSTSVADAIGIPRSTLRRRLIGATPFTVAEIEAVALHLHMTPEALMLTKVAA